MKRKAAQDGTQSDIQGLSKRLSRLLDTDPAEAIRQVKQIDIDSPDRLKKLFLRAAILVDGGRATDQRDAIREGLQLYREGYKTVPNGNVAYNLANAISSYVGMPPSGDGWIEHQESTRELRAEARQLYWKAARDETGTAELRTQAWTNLANQFTNSYRLGEAHDARLSALAIDPLNGVAAGTAAKDLLWLYNQGGCSELTRVEAIMLGKIAKQNQGRVRKYAGSRAAKKLADLADKLGDAPPRSPHEDSFIRWVEQQRLTLAPSVELVDPSLEKIDWLMLHGISERISRPNVSMPPPVFAMFNVLKADFILARDLLWRAINSNNWPTTGCFADTSDYANYGPESSAIVTAHRTALDILDKIAVVANHYFEIGQAPEKVFFGRLWRLKQDKKKELGALAPTVENAVREKVEALYGLVELADDYDVEDGILHSQKKLRNAGTHRFVVLHEFFDMDGVRPAVEIEHHPRDSFVEEAICALRVTRSALQMLALAIKQSEKCKAKQSSGPAVPIIVPDHDRIRGRKNANS